MTAEKGTPVVLAKGVTKFYELKGETIHALNDLDLSIESGEFMAIAGPSGSGKSTLLNLIGALDTPTAGSITVRGNDLSRMSEDRLAEMRRDHIGFVFQAYNLIPVLTAFENVEYVMLLQGVEPARRRERAYQVLKEVGLERMEKRRPNELSGGQQQRVAVARAIAAHPTIVLADEPTANLDTHTGDGLLDTMAQINAERGTTFIFSTHDTRVMARASRLVGLRDGQVVSDERR